MSKTPTDIPFTTIERAFDLAGYWLLNKWCPAVSRKGDGYRIRVVKSETRQGVCVNTTYDYFELDSDGLVLVAPRGYARDFKPGRITGIEQALAEQADASSGARRIL